VLTHHSGLLGVSQASSDMQVLLERRLTDEAAADAVELFVYQAQKHIGSLAAVLGGLDTLVFTGGIGERSAVIRREICDDLAFLGVELDSLRNAHGSGVISTDRAHVVVRVMAAQENLMVARHTFDLLAGGPGDGGKRHDLFGDQTFNAEELSRYAAPASAGGSASP
jgi:acetate kinase